MKAFNGHIDECNLQQNKRDSALSLFLCDLQLALQYNKPEYLKKALNNFQAARSEIIAVMPGLQVKVLNEMDDMELHYLIDTAYKDLEQICKESVADGFTEIQKQKLKEIEERLSDAFPITH